MDVGKININGAYLHGNYRFLIPASTPQDQREESEEQEEADDERKKVAAARDARPPTALIKKPLFFYGVKFLPLLLLFAVMVVVVVVAPAIGPGPTAGLLGARFERTGEPSGGGVPGGAAGRTHWAEDGGGVEGVGSLLAVMGVPRRALHVVHRPVGR